MQLVFKVTLLLPSFSLLTISNIITYIYITKRVFTIPSIIHPSPSLNLSSIPYLIKSVQAFTLVLTLLINLCDLVLQTFGYQIINILQIIKSHLNKIKSIKTFSSNKLNSIFLNYPLLNYHLNLLEFWLESTHPMTNKEETFILITNINKDLRDFLI